MCRLFKKKHHRGFQPTEADAAGDHQEEEDDQTLPGDYHHNPTTTTMMMMKNPSLGGIKQDLHHNITLHSSSSYSGIAAFDGHLPQLFSPEAVIPNLSSTGRDNVNGNDEMLEGSHNLLRLMASSAGNILQQQQERAPSLSMNGLYGSSSSEWSFLDKLLASHRHDRTQLDHGKSSSASSSFPCALSCCEGMLEGASGAAPPQPPHPPQGLFPFQCLGYDSSVDLFKFSK